MGYLHYGKWKKHLTILFISHNSEKKAHFIPFKLLKYCLKIWKLIIDSLLLLHYLMCDFWSVIYLNLWPTFEGKITFRHG